MQPLGHELAVPKSPSFVEITWFSKNPIYVIYATNGTNGIFTPWSKYMAQSQKGRLIHGLDKAIQGHCAIYFYLGVSIIYHKFKPFNGVVYIPDPSRRTLGIGNGQGCHVYDAWDVRGAQNFYFCEVRRDGICQNPYHPCMVYVPTFG